MECAIPNGLDHTRGPVDLLSGCLGRLRGVPEKEASEWDHKGDGKLEGIATRLYRVGKVRVVGYVIQDLHCSR